GVSPNVGYASARCGERVSRTEGSARLLSLRPQAEPRSPAFSTRVSEFPFKFCHLDRGRATRTGSEAKWNDPENLCCTMLLQGVLSRLLSCRSKFLERAQL